MTNRESFSYLLLTRFFVRMGKHSLPDKNWLDHRFAFFEQYCLPSVAEQIDQEFEWFVFVDESFSEGLLQKLRHLQKVRPFKVCRVKGGGRGAIQSTVRDACYCKYVITSRLDNDDAIGRYFVSDVKLAFCFQEREWIDQPYGMSVASGRLYRTIQISNSFLSLIETSNNCITCYGINHNKADQIASIRVSGREGAWLKIIHDRNLKNRIRHDDRLISSRCIKAALTGYPCSFRSLITDQDK